MALILDGKAVAKEIEKQLAQRVANIAASHPDALPILATVLVGDDPASATYVSMKGKACERVGMRSSRITLPESTSTEGLLSTITELNQNPNVDGILLQHPVPEQIDERACFDAIKLSKDVDGVTTHGFGRMSMGMEAYGSATPQGIMHLLNYYNIDLSGLHAVVVGRSPILGKPMAMMLCEANATVTLCHSRTKNLAEHIKQADLVVGAVGKPKFIQAQWIKDDAIVIDAGFHPQKCGDIELSESLIARVRAYTPVPGGVGPMTIATLVAQSVQACEKRLGITHSKLAFAN